MIENLFVSATHNEHGSGCAAAQYIKHVTITKDHTNKVRLSLQLILSVLDAELEKTPSIFALHIYTDNLELFNSHNNKRNEDDPNIGLWNRLDEHKTKNKIIFKYVMQANSNNIRQCNDHSRLMFEDTFGYWKVIP